MTEKDAAPKCPETHNGVPCQRRMKRMSDGPWLHGGGHWFMSDDLTACMDAGHFDPANILAMTPLVHLDAPCPRRVTSPERHPCGHASRTVGCGGCDPGAIEYVREDGGPWIRVAPPEGSER